MKSYPFFQRMVIFQEFQKWIFGNDGVTRNIRNARRKSDDRGTHNFGDAQFLEMRQSPRFLSTQNVEILLTHYQTTNFILFQTERLQTTISNLTKWQKVIQMGRKHCGKRRNCLLGSISPFPTVFSKGLFSRGVKRCHCVGMG